MTRVAVLFPGQGAQFVGMGKALHDALESVRRLFEEASDVSGKDMRRLCFEGPETTLVQTDNVQPAMILVNLSCYEALREQGFEPSAAAGHSVGEYAALCAAGVLSFADAIRLVSVRSTAMKAEAERFPGSMAAVFGLGAEVLAAICDEEAAGSVQLANLNAPGQTVVTGTADGLQRVAKAAKARGAKLVVPLKVSGPWHSRFMAGAQPALRQALGECTLNPPRIEVIANLTAAPHPADAGEIRTALVEQIVSPVLWTQSMRALIDDGYATFVEAGPGRVLTGLLKDMGPGLRTFNVQDPDSLAKYSAAVELPSA